MRLSGEPDMFDVHDAMDAAEAKEERLMRNEDDINYEALASVMGRPGHGKISPWFTIEKLEQENDNLRRKLEVAVEALTYAESRGRLRHMVVNPDDVLRAIAVNSAAALREIGGE